MRYIKCIFRKSKHSEEKNGNVNVCVCVCVCVLQIQLTRLSKFFQQSARLAVETTVLSADVRRTVVNPSPHDACLPRWSSAPARLAGEGAPTDRRDDVDAATSPTWLAPSVRHQLQQVFSLDVGTLERSQQHLQQQQLLQQQLPSNDDDRTGSTRL